ncbi:LutC/YkgG family protein [Virgibacillus halodenitrificans]|uniref:Lactate utilization protein C n=1 Tax=Virgibacillus halodenitrificans TaxID=1482 RepID=A0ABR7VGE2_VIRHA|nr:lactate utilization protein C [Virgibacillus halodenitrificans]MBD1221026.1 lactate utilization protein C [Virgibacillus halodenitrificans]
MAIQNRDRFLNKLANNLGRPRRTEGVKRPEWSVQPQWQVLEGCSQDELVDVLEKQCKAIHTDFKRTTIAELPQTVEETVAVYGKKIITAKDDRNEKFGLDLLFNKLRTEDMEVHEWDSTAGLENQIIAERADVGINFSDITLAESGTVTLFNNKDNGRSISLLPENFIAIIPKSTIVPRMTQAAKQIHEAHEQGHMVSPCISFISGPSNSADIEMNLIVGVHGPVRATYIVVDDGD